MQSLVHRIRKFHTDEDGIEQLNAVMLLALAAVVLLVLWGFWDEINSWAKKKLDAILGK